MRILFNKWEQVTPEIQALLDRRTEQLRDQDRQTQREESAVLWFAELEIQGETYLISLEQISAALPLSRVTPVPRSPAHIIGIMRYQDGLMTVMSLMSLLGVRGWHIDPQVLLILELPGSRRIAVDCERPPKPTAWPVTLMEEARARGRRRGPFVDITIDGHRLIHLIDDLPRLLEPSEADHE